MWGVKYFALKVICIYTCMWNTWHLLDVFKIQCHTFTSHRTYGILQDLFFFLLFSLEEYFLKSFLCDKTFETFHAWKILFLWGLARSFHASLYLRLLWECWYYCDLACSGVSLSRHLSIFKIDSFLNLLKSHNFSSFLASLTVIYISSLAVFCLLSFLIK